ncbi:transcription elongation factor B polypeptide 3 [Senna tora]|uniref:Transcription elongation factor B polypeptide 3 n=1 Tax=Senna tora TaxID=362788 RepID=A0A834WC68_9FABA|nr:transcription elongation factor B polypeptide 3 [Senna tora]
MSVRKKVPSLVDLCVQKTIDNVRYLGDVGETDAHLLERILPHCTVDQLMHVEKSTEGRDLSPVTDKLWKIFFEKQFGTNSTNQVIKRMRDKKVSYKWIQLYEAKLKEVAEAEKKSFDRIRQLYKKEVDRRQSKQVRLCTKVPPSSKRKFWADGGSGYNVSNVKSNIMKKSRIEYLKSPEVRNLAAIRKKPSIQRTNRIVRPFDLVSLRVTLEITLSSSSIIKKGGISGNGSTSKRLNL